MNADRRWWEAKTPQETHSGLWAAYEVARANDPDRSRRFRTMRTYYAEGVVKYEIGSEATGHMTVSRHNLLASVVDTAVTKVLDSRPDPEVLTSGGTTKLQRQAKALTKWLSACVKAEGLYKVVEKAGREAILNGTGGFRVFERAGKPAYEIVYQDHVFVDPLEADNDAVMTYYWERHVDRRVLESIYPKAAKLIRETSAVRHGDGEGEGASSVEGLPDTLVGTSDMLLVVQAYRIAASDDPKDAGRFAVCVQGGLLHDEVYSSEEPPWVTLRWCERPRSHWGIGLGETLSGIQDQIDRHQETVDESLDAMPPAAFAQTGSLKRRQMDNGIARLYEYDGSSPPTLWAPGAAAVQGHTERERYLSELVYQLAGVSSMEAGAQKPAGLNSGRAQLVHQDIKSQRLKPQIQDVEDAYTSAFERTILVADGIVEGKRDKVNGKHRMRYLAGKGRDLEELTYSDLRLRDTLYRVRIFPVSKLPDSPAGRQERVTELVQAGFLDQEEGLRAMGFPDLEAILEQRSSMRDYAHFLVDKALEGKAAAEFLTPDDDLTEVMRYGQQMRARTMLSSDSDNPDEVFDQLEPLRDLLGQCAALQTQKMQAAAHPQPPAAPPGAPPAPPSAPPGVPVL